MVCLGDAASVGVTETARGAENKNSAVLCYKQLHFLPLPGVLLALANKNEVLSRCLLSHTKLFLVKSVLQNASEVNNFNLVWLHKQLSMAKQTA